MSTQPQSKVITPTIGRRIWYWASDYDRGLLEENQPSSLMRSSDDRKPLDAGVAYVHSDRLINITVADHSGRMHARTSVTLYQPGDEIPEDLDGGFCTWMDYQVNQEAQSKPSTTVDKYFAYAHLPAHLQVVSKPLGQLAELMEQLLPAGPEKSAGMRKLLEAKDCFVRAALDRAPADLIAAQPITDTDRLHAWVYVMINGGKLDPELESALEKVAFVEAATEAELLPSFTLFLDTIVSYQRAPRQHTEDPDHAEA